MLAVTMFAQEMALHGPSFRSPTFFPNTSCAVCSEPQRDGNNVLLRVEPHHHLVSAPYAAMSLGIHCVHYKGKLP